MIPWTVPPRKRLAAVLHHSLNRNPAGSRLVASVMRGKRQQKHERAGPTRWKCSSSWRRDGRNWARAPCCLQIWQATRQAPGDSQPMGSASQGQRRAEHCRQQDSTDGTAWVSVLQGGLVAWGLCWQETEKQTQTRARLHLWAGICPELAGLGKGRLAASRDMRAWEGGAEGRKFPPDSPSGVSWPEIETLESPTEQPFARLGLERGIPARKKD